LKDESVARDQVLRIAVEDELVVQRPRAGERPGVQRGGGGAQELG
jgi:hypothetical protein